jgi:hypothetical protein
MTTQRKRRGLELGLLLTLIQLAPARAAEPAEPTRAAPYTPPATVETDDFEHRFGFSVGYTHVTGININVLPQRVDYTVVWQGWGAGVAFIFDLREKGASRDTITLGGLTLRRNVAIGEHVLWGGVELGIARLSRDWHSRGATLLYHGTSSGTELGFEFDRTARVRPFFSVRVDLPWYATELEKLTPASDAASGSSVILIHHSREWTPLFGFWGGVAL